MDNNIISLLIGISSSLVATGIFIGISELVRRKLIPWYSDQIYRSVRIDWEWELIEIDNTKYDNIKMKLSLEQSGEDIKGTYSHISKDDTTDEYSLEGRIRNMYFVATAIPKSNRHVDAMSLLFHVNHIDSNLSMSGSILAKDTSSKVISTDGIKFIWKDS